MNQIHSIENKVWPQLRKFRKPDPIIAFDPYLFMIYNFWKSIEKTNYKYGFDKSSPYKKYKVPFI